MTKKSNYLRRALFLDLDGTVRYSLKGEFINQPSDIALYPDVEPKLWEYRNEGYLILGVSNQGGVAFGLKTPEGCDAEVERTLELFERNPFDGIKCCYHHPKGKTAPFNHASVFRKPGIGMLALYEYELWTNLALMIDWENSLLVGDRNEDKECAAGANIEFVWASVFFNRPNETA